MTRHDELKNRLMKWGALSDLGAPETIEKQYDELADFILGFLERGEAEEEIARQTYNKLRHGFSLSHFPDTDEMASRLQAWFQGGEGV